jgi:hypothetical protein
VPVRVAGEAFAVLDAGRGVERKCAGAAGRDCRPLRFGRRRGAGRAVLTGTAALRTAADRLERVVADDLWPLPTYAEMLFIR